jgi:hypothetical protein
MGKGLGDHTGPLFSTKRRLMGSRKNSHRRMQRETEEQCGKESQWPTVRYKTIKGSLVGRVQRATPRERVEKSKVNSVSYDEPCAEKGRVRST